MYEYTIRNNVNSGLSPSVCGGREIEGYMGGEFRMRGSGAGGGLGGRGWGSGPGGGRVGWGGGGRGGWGGRAGSN